MHGILKTHEQIYTRATSMYQYSQHSKSPTQGRGLSDMFQSRKHVYESEDSSVLLKISGMHNREFRCKHNILHIYSPKVWLEVSSLCGDQTDKTHSKESGV